MSTSPGGMKQGAESMPGLRGVMVSPQEFATLASKVRGLRYNALDTKKNQTAEGSYLDRKSAVGHVRSEFKQPGEHEHVFVAYDSKDNIVGFLAVHTTPAGRLAEAEELWTALPGHRQRAIIGKLFGVAQSFLNHHGYPRLTLAPEQASSDFSVVSSGGDFHRFVRIEKGEEDSQFPETMHENESTPEAEPTTPERFDEPDTLEEAA